MRILRFAITFLLIAVPCWAAMDQIAGQDISGLDQIAGQTISGLDQIAGQNISSGGGGTGTLGKETIGASTAGVNSSRIQKVTYSGTDFTLAKGFRYSPSSSSADIYIMIYDDVSGTPTNLLAESDLNSVQSNGDWDEYSFSGANQITIENGTTYWIGYHTDATVDYSYDGDDAWDTLWANLTGYATPPDPYPGGTASDNTFSLFIGDATATAP